MKTIFFIAKNMCCGCCFSCNNNLCDSYASDGWCNLCLNYDCINNPCSSIGCDMFCTDCSNINCLGHERFDTQRVLLKNC